MEHLNKHEHEVISQFLKNASTIGLNRIDDESFYWPTEYKDNFPEDSNIHFAYGYSKFVVIFGDIDWVIKIPRPKVSQDHCMREARNYHLAKENHIEEFFAPTYFYTSCDGVDIYLQAKCRCDSEKVSDSFFDFMSQNYDIDEFENEEDYNSAVSCDVDDMEENEAIEAMFGYNEFLENFIDKRGINDLHEANFGYDMNTGDPMIIDFSGFYSWDEDEQDPDEEMEVINCDLENLFAVKSAS